MYKYLFGGQKVQIFWKNRIFVCPMWYLYEIDIRKVIYKYLFGRQKNQVF